MKNKVLFITPKCSHYHIGFFEELSSKTDVKFLFDSGDNKANNPLLKSYNGNYKHERLRNIKIFNNSIIFGFLRLIKEINKKDIVIKSDENQFNILLIVFLSKIFNKKIIFWCSLWKDQDVSFSKLKYVFQRFYLKRADAIICYGVHVKEYLEEKYLIEKNKLFIEHHSTNPKLYTDRTIKIDIRIQGKKNLLYIGRLAEEKGLEYLLKAFSGNASKAHLHIVGNGPLENKLKQIVRDQLIDGSVTFHGFYEPKLLYNFYEQADLVILPSVSTPWITETWGYVVNEALYYGAPVIVTESVGAAAGGLVVDRFNGLIVDERSVESLNQAINELLGNKELYLTLRNNTAVKLKEWNNSQMTNDFITVLNAVAD